MTTIEHFYPWRYTPLQAWLNRRPSAFFEIFYVCFRQHALRFHFVACELKVLSTSKSSQPNALFIMMKILNCLENNDSVLHSWPTEVSIISRAESLENHQISSTEAHWVFTLPPLMTDLEHGKITSWSQTFANSSPSLWHFCQNLWLEE